MLHMLENTQAPKVTYLKDYLSPAYLIETVDLTFELDPNKTKVTSFLKIIKNKARPEKNLPLILNGENLELISIKLDNKLLKPEDYKVDNEKLVINTVPEIFSLEITNYINPRANTELSGLYCPDNTFCTQCEAEGFRRITYYPDRPDVMASFTTTIIADRVLYPILLSNGNKIAEKKISEKLHSVTWQDPFKKPAYLFALVAGDLDFVEDFFVTQSGRKVTLQIFVEKNQHDKTAHAMESVKKAMRWDEIAYGREYDLDIFMIAAINDFNMGAMENKGLNIFNAKYILAKPETATDADYEGIQLVVGHEYFHNWSGDRVTCRDWFQLSLKEGFTVFREQEFTADMTSALVERINTVRTLRHSQFQEAAGPLSHPVQPDSYIEINNFYTTTIYNKGAEVIRMMKVLLGPDDFRKATDLYFSRNDGQAVTIEEFVKAMEDASGKDLKQFRLWYHQAGTPEVTVKTQYDAAKKEFVLNIKQYCPPTPGQPDKKPFHIPIAMGLLNSQGQNMPLQLKGESAPCTQSTRVLELKNSTDTFCFVNVAEQPVVSLLRHFSAPVKLNTEYTDKELLFLHQYDSDGFNKWEANQQIACRVLLDLVHKIQNNQPLVLDPGFIENYKKILQSDFSDKAFLSELLILPSESYVGELMTVVDVDAIHKARQFVRRQLAEKLNADFLMAYQNHKVSGPYEISLEAIGKRRFKNICLSYLMVLNNELERDLALKQFQQANNMTDQLAAFGSFVNADCPEREAVIKDFYNQWQKDLLVLDKWFAIQARSELPGTLRRVRELMKNPGFDIKNPNKVRALIGAFCHENIDQFHAKNGEGYEFLAEQVLFLDKLNPQIAARLLMPLTNWRRYDEPRQKLMRAELEKIVKTKNLSKDTYEIAAKSLK